MKSFKGLFYSLTVLVSSTAIASNVCLLDSYRVQTGYMTSASQLALLKKNIQLPRNINSTTAEKIKRVENHIAKTWKKNSAPGMTAPRLANIIVKVAESVGVDYQVLAAIVAKESGYCMFRLNKTGGDSGCMQFTSPALTEMKHQFGFAGELKHSPGVPEALNQLAKNYFGSETDGRFLAFKKWWALDIVQMKRSLRGEGNYEFDVLSGGLFLKFILSIANGNYSVAVRNYNGSSKKHAYQQSVMGNASKVSWDLSETDEQCEDELNFEAAIYRNSCEMTDDPEKCFNSYLQTLPNSI